MPIPRYRVCPMRRLLFIIPLAVLSCCGGYDGSEEEQTMQGVTVTDNVPFAHETIQDILDRGELPPQGDRVAPSHHIE